MKNARILWSTLILVVFFTACNGAGGGHDDHGDHGDHGGGEHHDHENENTATLTAEQMKSIQIEFGMIEKKQLTASLKANGLLKVPNQNRANVTSLSGGIIKSILVQTGNTVKRGQVIATISDKAYIILQEEYLSTSAKLEWTQLEFDRQKQLQAGNAGALKNLQAIESEFKSLKAKKASFQKQLELVGINAETLTSENMRSTISITSPIDGTISNVMVNLGSYAEPSSAVAEIVDNSQLHLDLFVYEEDLPKMRIGQTIHFTLTNNPVDEYDADIYAISNTFEENMKAVAVHAMVKGEKAGLIDGMSITALVSLDSATVDAVPTSAIVNHEGQDYIFIVTDEHSEEEHHGAGETEEAEHDHDEHGHDHGDHEGGGHESKEMTFEKIPVRKGTTDIGYSEITLLRDIPQNSRIVTNGAFFLMAKINNKGQAHSH